MTKIISAALLLLVTVGSISAEWAVIPLDRLVADSDLVVVGTLHSAEEDETGIGSGYILVDQIVTTSSLTGLKTTSGERLGVGDDLKITWSDNWACASGMHTTRVGKKGVWLLKVKQDGTVDAGHPGRFQPIDEVEKIRKMLIRVGPSAAVDVRGPKATENIYFLDKKIGSDATRKTALAFLRTSIVLLFAAGLYGVLYKSRFRIR